MAADRKEYEYARKEYVEGSSFGGQAGADLAAGAGAIGATAGAGIGAIFGPLGMVIGAAIGGVGGLIVTAITDANEDTKAQNLESDESYRKAMDAYTAGNTAVFNSYETLAKVLGKTTNELTDTERALVDNTAETKALAEAYRANEAGK